VVRARASTPDALRPVFRADWLRMTSFERGLGHVLWTESTDDAIARLEREWDRPEVGSVKMTPTGANAMRAMDDPPEALRRFYVEAWWASGAGLAAVVEQEVQAVTALVLVPAGLSRAVPGRTG